MAKETYYAWSVFDIDRNEWGQVQSRIQPGEKITQEMIGVTDADWAELLEAGAIRTEPYPQTRSDLSPAEHQRAETHQKKTREMEIAPYLGSRFDAVPPEHEAEPMSADLPSSSGEQQGPTTPAEAKESEPKSTLDKILGT